MSEKLVFDKYYSLWTLLSQTRSAIFKARHKVVGQYLPPNQAATLIAVWARDGQITPAVLSRHLFLEPHTVSELIKRMQQKGLVMKKKDARRGNVVRINITEKGRQMCRKVMGQELIHGYMSALTEGQRQELRKILTVLHEEAMKDIGIEEEEIILP